MLIWLSAHRRTFHVLSIVLASLIAPATTLATPSSAAPLPPGIQVAEAPAYWGSIGGSAVCNRLWTESRGYVPTAPGTRPLFLYFIGSELAAGSRI